MLLALPRCGSCARARPCATDQARASAVMARDHSSKSQRRADIFCGGVRYQCMHSAQCTLPMSTYPRTLFPRARSPPSHPFNLLPCTLTKGVVSPLTLTELTSVHQGDSTPAARPRRGSFALIMTWRTRRGTFWVGGSPLQSISQAPSVDAT